MPFINSMDLLRRSVNPDDSQNSELVPSNLIDLAPALPLMATAVFIANFAFEQVRSGQPPLHTHSETFLQDLINRLIRPTKAQVQAPRMEKRDATTVAEQLSPGVQMIGSLIEMVPEAHREAIRMVAAVEFYTLLLDTEIQSINPAQLADTVRALDPTLQFFCLHLQQLAYAVNELADSPQSKPIDSSLLTSRILLLQQLIMHFGRTNETDLSEAGTAISILFNLVYNNPQVRPSEHTQTTSSMRWILAQNTNSYEAPILPAGQLLGAVHASELINTQILVRYPVETLIADRERLLRALSISLRSPEEDRRSGIVQSSVEQNHLFVNRILEQVLQSLQSESQALNAKEIAALTEVVLRISTQLISSANSSIDNRSKQTAVQVDKLFEIMQEILDKCGQLGLPIDTIYTEVFKTITNLEYALGEKRSYRLADAAIMPIRNMGSTEPATPSRDRLINSVLANTPPDEFASYAMRFANMRFGKVSPRDISHLMYLVQKAILAGNTQFITTKIEGSPLWFVALASNNFMPEFASFQSIQQMLPLLANLLFPDAVTPTSQYAMLLHTCVQYLDLNQLRVDTGLFDAVSKELDGIQQEQNARIAMAAFARSVTLTTRWCREISSADANTTIQGSAGTDSTVSVEIVQNHLSEVAKQLQALDRIPYLLDSDKRQLLEEEFSIQSLIPEFARAVIDVSRHLNIVALSNLSYCLLKLPGDHMKKLDLRPAVRSHGKNLWKGMYSNTMLGSYFIQQGRLEDVLQEAVEGRLPVSRTVDGLLNRASGNLHEGPVEMRALVNNRDFQMLLVQLLREVPAKLETAGGNGSAAEIDCLRRVMQIPILNTTVHTLAKSNSLTRKLNALKISI